MSSRSAALEEENRHLKQENKRLRDELVQKNALITSLEAQIKSLIKDGELLHGRNGSVSVNTRTGPGGLPPKAPTKTRPSIQEDDDDESTRPPSFHSNTSRRPSLDPPSRNESEMASPLPRPDMKAPRLLNRADVLESGVGTVLSESIAEEEEENEDDAESDGGVVEGQKDGSDIGGRGGLRQVKGAIKALPRELSIFNSDDDDVTKYSIDDNMPTYHLESTEMRDAYNARGLYTGSVARKLQLPHGRGIMKYHHQGRSYEGEWVHGHWHGMGRIRNANGDIYEGQVVNDLRDGKGKLFYADGRLFDGDFQQDDPVQGTLTFPDGAKYVGELHNGARHGYGVYYFTDKSKYEGYSVMNIFEGKGKMTWTDGGWYEGEWLQGEIHGYGIEIRADGSLRHKGQWSKGVPIRL